MLCILTEGKVRANFKCIRCASQAVCQIIDSLKSSMAFSLKSSKILRLVVYKIERDNLLQANKIHSMFLWPYGTERFENKIYY